MFWPLLQSSLPVWLGDRKSHHLHAVEETEAGSLRSHGLLDVNGLHKTLKRSLGKSGHGLLGARTVCRRAAHAQAAPVPSPCCSWRPGWGFVT